MTKVSPTTGRAYSAKLSAAETEAVSAAILADQHASAVTIARRVKVGVESVRRIRRRLLGSDVCRVTSERASAYVEAVRKFGGDLTLARRSLKIDEIEAEACARQAALLGLLPDGLPLAARPAPGFEVAGIATITNAAGVVRSRSIRTRRAAGARFETPAGHHIKGVSALVDAEGRVTQQWLKTRVDGPDPEQIKTALTEALAAWRGCAGTVPQPGETSADLLTQYTIADAHMGLLSWGRETGQPYDLNIAADMLTGAVSDLVSRAAPSRTAIILFLGDTTHQNNNANMTPRSGHVLDVDGRFQKVLRATCEVAMQLVWRALEKHERVIVRFVPGNHDPEVAIALTLALAMAFANDPRVTIDETPGGHFYHRFGAVLIGATHGHTMPPERMAMMLAVDRAADWGATKHRHFFFGHVHRESAKEIAGVRVESFNSPAGRDAYAHDGGFRSGRALVAITYHQSRGEIGRHRVNIG
jgi:hypothetical protein